MREYMDLFYTEERNEMQRLDAYLPDSEGFDTVVFFHGGGLAHGDRKSDPVMFGLKERGFGFVSVEYRMLPQAHFPDFLEDAAAAIAYVQRHLTEWGGSGRLFVSGSSAGAYMTMMLCLDPQYLTKAGVEPDSVTGYLSNSAQQFAHFAVMKDRGLDGRLEHIDETAPISLVREGMTIRPLCMLYYSEDMVCRPEENRLMYASMKRFLPEDSLPELHEIAGKHCKPNDPEQFLNLCERFLRSV